MLLELLVIVFLVVMGVLGIALTIGYYHVYKMQYTIMLTEERTSDGGQ